MKLLVQRILQRLLGFNTYLNLFSVFKILTLKWDKKENDFFLLLKLIKPGGVVLDIGANVGIMTYYLSKSAGKTGKVFAFEPNPENFKALTQVVNRFNLKNVTCYEQGLGEKSETKDLIMPIFRKVKMQGLSYISTSDQIVQVGTKYSINIDALDNYANIFNSNLPVTAIKIDVENFEFEVLKGAQKTISKFKPMIYCELWENQNRQDSIHFLEGLGYKTMVTGEKGLVKFTDQKKQNFFFITQDQLSLLK